MRFNAEEAASVFGQVLTGSLMGKLQRQEQERQRALEQQNQQLQAFQLKSSLEDKARERAMAPLTALSPYVKDFDPVSRARYIENLSKAAGGQIGTPPDFATLAQIYGANTPAGKMFAGPAAPPVTPAPLSFTPTGAAQAMGISPIQIPAMGGTPAPAPAPAPYPNLAPEQRAGMPGEFQPGPAVSAPAPAPAPTATAATTTAPPVQPDLTIEAAGGPYRIAGVDEKRRQRIAQRYQKVADKLANVVPGSVLDQTVGSDIAGFNANPQTEDEARQAEQQLAQWEWALRGTSPAARGAADRAGRETRKEVDADIDAFKQAPPDQALPLLMNLYDRIKETGKTGGNRGVGFRLIGQQKDIEHALDLARQAEETSDPAQAARFKQQAEREAKNIQGRVGRGLTTDQENKLLDKAFKMIRLMSTEELTNQGGARGVFENLGIGYLVDGIDSNFAGAKLEERWDKIVGRITTLAGKDPATQQLVLGEARRIAQLLGKKVEIPAEVYKTLNELEKTRLEREKQLIRITGPREKRAEAMVEFARRRDVRAGQRHKAAMAKLKQGGADVKPAAELYKRWRSAEKNVDDLLTTFNVTEDEESWADAGLEPYEEDEIRNAIAMRDSAGADYDSYLSSRGVKITDPMQQAGRQSAPTGAPAHAGLADAIPEENRGQRTNRAIARGTAAPQAAPQTGQKGPFSNYLEARNYYKKKYPTASGQYIDNFIARKFGFRKGR